MVLVRPPSFHVFGEHAERALARSLDVRTDSLTGTQDWSEITQPFTVPSGTTRIVVRVLRTPSMKFDNKIQGTAWIDSLRLEAR